VSQTQDAAGRYERYALIFDPDRSSQLGAEALGLVERGIDPLFAGDLDEAHLLALEGTGRVGALIIPGTLPIALIDAVLDRIGPQLWAGAHAVVLVGPPDDREVLRALRDRGLSWVLREPYDAAEFRFVVAGALATEDKLDPRGGLRVPISLPVSVGFDGVTQQGVVRNLSIGGAYVALPEPPAPGTALELSLQLGDRGFATGAAAVYRQAVDAGGRAVREAGMGVAFRPLDDDDRSALAAFITDRIGCFRL
jgi:hypothetical protein